MPVYVRPDFRGLETLFRVEKIFDILITIPVISTLEKAK